MSTVEAENPYDPPHAYGDSEEFEDDTDATDVDVLPWKIGAFLSIPLLEIIAQCVFTTDGERAILVAPAFVIVLMIALFDLIFQARGRASNHPESMRMWFTTGLWLGGLGLFAIALSVAYKNEAYFVAADVFHWYLEFVGVAFLGVWAFSGYSSQVIARALGKACFLMAFIGITVVALGVLGKITSGFGGKTVVGFLNWRLELGRGYPLIPLIITSALLFYAPRNHKRLPLLHVLTLFLLGICLLYTLKRTQWLLFPICFVGILLPKRSYIPLLILGAFSAVLLFGFHQMSPNTLPTFIDHAKDFLTYNEDWTIDQTIDTRQLQIDETLKVAAKEWWGHGFGAEVYITTPSGKRVEALHYVHSLYAYYALQFGAPGCFVAFGVLLVTVLGLYLVMDTNPAAQWMVRSALFSIFALAASGLMMVSIHTTLAGVVLAMAVVALARCHYPHPLDNHYGHFDGDHDEYDEEGYGEHEEDADEENLEHPHEVAHDENDISEDEIPDEAHSHRR